MIGRLVALRPETEWAYVVPPGDPAVKRVNIGTRSRPVACLVVEHLLPSSGRRQVAKGFVRVVFNGRLLWFNAMLVEQVT